MYALKVNNLVTKLKRLHSQRILDPLKMYKFKVKKKNTYQWSGTRNMVSGIRKFGLQVKPNYTERVPKYRAKTVARYNYLVLYQ